MTTHPESCGCCTGTRDRTPVRIANRPGLSEIAYRAGSYAHFRDSMLAGLTRSDRPDLARLRTRDPSDFTIALIDAWAVVGDVLSFYTERVANENYLGTATERRSVSDLVGLIGYRLGEGVAATTTLAYTLDTAPTSPTAVPIGAGAKVQTLPGPGELPQTFETVEDLEARAGWNAPRVRQTEPRVPQDGDLDLLLQGAATGVHLGDPLLFVADGWTPAGGFSLARATSVAVDPARQRTLVSFAPALDGLGGASAVRVWLMRQRSALFGYNASSPLLLVDDVKLALADAGLLNTDSTDWLFDALGAGAVDLDASYDGIAAGTPVVLSNAGDRVLAMVTSVAEAARTAYGISAKVTRLGLGPATVDLAAFGGDRTRGTTLSVRGEELSLGEVPVTTPVFGDALALALPLDPVDGPRPVLVCGRRPRLRVATVWGAVVVFDDGRIWFPGPDDEPIVLGMDSDPAGPGTWHVRIRTDQGVEGTITSPSSGFVFAPAHADDPVTGEITVVEAVTGTVLQLAEPLVNAYDRHHVMGRSVEIWGNIVEATHGESVVGEVLGSGDASTTFQEVTLRRAPLTLVPAPTAAGGESTLRVSVNGVQWREVPALYGHRSRDRVFTTTTADDGRTVVQFGDGVSGARPPTGQDNIRAGYRAGTGTAGLAAADQLSLLMTRPLGVKSVRNPLAATGAADSEVAADAAENAPRTVLTLDRVVSLRDYEDFAANFAGIGKASATWTWDGIVRGVVLTVAGVGGAAVHADDPLVTGLTAAVLAAGDARVPLVVRPAISGLFALQAAVVVDADHVAETVIGGARTALLDHYSFSRRAFGQLVSLAEVVTVLHDVEGVLGVLVTRLHRTGETALRHPFLLARAPVAGQPPPVDGAEILTIDPDQVTMEVAP